MNGLTKDACHETLATARGDARDSAETRAHLAQCQACREELAQLRWLTQHARAALSRTTDLEIVLPATAKASSFGGRLPALALAAAATFAIVAVSLRATGPTPAAPPRAQVADSAPAGMTPVRGPVVIELQPEPGDRLPYVVRGPHGVQRGTLELRSHEPLERISTNAAVVVNSF